MDKKTIVKGIVLFVIYIFIFGYLIRYVVNNETIMKQIVSSPLQYSVLGLFCSFLSVIFSGLMDVSCARVYDVRIRYGEAVGLTFVASAVNLFLPLQFGSVIKAIYLKRKMSLSYSKYVSIVSGTIVINFMITLLQVMVCLIVSVFRWNYDSLYIWIMLSVFAIIVICLVLFLYFKDFVLRIVPFKRVMVPIIEGFFSLAQNFRAVVLVTLNFMIIAFVGAIRFLDIFALLGYKGGILDSVLYFGLYTASTLLPVLPGNIGISESIVGVMNTILGSEFEIGVTAVMINRIYYYVVVLVGATASAFPIWVLFNRSKER